MVLESIPHNRFIKLFELSTYVERFAYYEKSILYLNLDNQLI